MIVHSTIAILMVILFVKAFDSLIVNNDTKKEVRQLAKKCEFYDTDLFVVLTEDTNAEIMHFFGGLHNFLQCYNSLHFFVNPEMYQAALSWLYKVDSRVTLRVIDTFNPVTGMNVTLSSKIAVKHWLQMWADFYVTASGADYVMFMETEAIITLPVSRATIFDPVGRPYLGCRDNRTTTGKNYYMKPCTDMLGADVCAMNNSKTKVFPYYPFTVSVSIFEPFRALVTQRMNTMFGDVKSFDDGIMAWVNKFARRATHINSHFLLGNFINAKYPDRVHPIYTPNKNEWRADMEGAKWIPPTTLPEWYCDALGYDEYGTNYSAYFEHSHKYHKAHADIIRSNKFFGGCLGQYWIEEEIGRHCSMDMISQLPTNLKLYPDKAFNLKYYRKHYFDYDA